MTKLVLATIAVLVAARPASAGEWPEASPFHLAPFVGAYVPTGTQRDALEDSALVGFTASVDLAPSLAVVGAFGWAPTRVRHLRDGEIDLFQADVGLQLQHGVGVARGIRLEPFAGAGVGLRTYHPRHLGKDAEAFGSWYAGGGASLQYGRSTVTLAARYYLSTYDSPDPALPGGAVARADLALAASVGVRF